MTDVVVSDEYVDVILQVARDEPTIAAVLREICTLENGVRDGALDVVGAHLRAHDAPRDVLACLDALRREDVARRIAQRLPRGE